jgi:acetyl esterase/lipase
VVILPGGAYGMLSMANEGSSEGKFFLAHNVAAFVLRYRHGPQYHYPTPLLDSQRALRVIRARAEEFHVDRNKVGILGFSAGGHLAALTTTSYDNKLLPEAPYVPDAADALSAKPAFALLLYPVIDLTDDAVTHRGSRTNLTQDNKELYEALSPQKHVMRDTPPVFLVHGTNDRTVPVMNSILFYEACVKAGVSAEMHILENASHGFGMGLTQNDEAPKAWPDQALRFMARHKWIPTP